MNPEPETRSVLCADTPRDRRNQLRFAAYCLLWALLFVGSVFLLKRELLPAGPLAWLVAALPTVAAIPVVVAFTRFLREADELQRLIQLQALAIGFAGGFFVVCGYSVFERLGAPEANSVDLVAVMPILYAISLLVGQWRYR